MTTLNDLSREILELEWRLNDCENDLAAQERAVAEYLNVLGTRDENFDNYAAMIGELQARAAHRRAEAQRQAQRAIADESREGWLSERLRAEKAGCQNG